MILAQVWPKQSSPPWTTGGQRAHLTKNMRIAYNNEQCLGTSDSHIEALGVTEETHTVTYINTDQ